MNLIIKILFEIKNILEKKYNVIIIDNLSIISVVGNNTKKIKNIGYIFDINAHYNVITTSYSSNDMIVSFVIKTEFSVNMTQKIHNYLF